MDKPLLVIPDIHGRYDSLLGLLKKAGELDAENVRTHKHKVVCVGDLCNAVQSSINADAECLLHARDLIDVLLIGNHEMGWIYGEGMSFYGFYDAPANGSLYRQMAREGFVVPSYLVPEHNLLITHAGVSQHYHFTSAREAHEMIKEVYETPVAEREKLGKFESTPKWCLITGVSFYRGGTDPAPGILWKDWSGDKMNKNFSQIVGHTPQPNPQLWTRANGTFTLNIDCGGKGGKGATAAILTTDGEISYIAWSP